MNRGRKIKQTLSIKDDENNSPKNESTATKHKLLTSCRRVGLNRKRKHVLSGSSSDINISSPNNSFTEIDISVKRNESISGTNTINTETPVIKKNIKPRKSSLGARSKRTNQTANTSADVILSPEQILKKYNINSDVSIVLTRCDFDKHILSRDNVRESPVDISMRIENEAISSTPLESNNSEIQTNHISTTIEDATTLENTENKTLNEIDVTEKINQSTTSKKIKDLFGENSDDTDFELHFKQKKRKRFSLKTKNKDTSFSQDTNNGSSQNSMEGTDTEKSEKRSKIDEKKKKLIKSNKNSTSESLGDTNPDTLKIKSKQSKEEKQHNKIDSQNDSDEIPEFNVNIPRKKRKRSRSPSKKSLINKKEIAAKSRPNNSDSDDDFVEKPRREKKDPDIKKKINIPVPDPLNRIEHIRIRENKSYTIMHMNNISSYVKYYDNDVNLKRTESDDNQQTSQPVVSNVKTTMILERKDYLNKRSQETNRSENSEPVHAVSDGVENSDPTNAVSNSVEISDPTNAVSNSVEISDPRNAVSDGAENSDLKNAVSDGVGNPESVNAVSDGVENSDPKNAVNDGVENSDPKNAVSDGVENSDPRNAVSDGVENSEPVLAVSDGAENSDPSNAVSDGVENFETNLASDVTEFSKNPERISDSPKKSETVKTVSNTFAGFSLDFIENPESANIDNFSVENPDFNDIENSNDIENLDSNDSSGKREAVKDIEKPETSDLDKPESVSDIESADDAQNEMKKMLKLKCNLITQIKMKRDKLDSLKRIMAYKEEHNLDDLTKTTLQFKYTLQEALVDLLSHLKTHTERNFNMLLLLGFLKIPSEMVGYNDETKSFE